MIGRFLTGVKRAENGCAFWIVASAAALAVYVMRVSGVMS